MVSRISEISTIISFPRAKTYLDYFKDESNVIQREVQAYELYIWNIKISAAFLEIICLYEVALRNAIINALEANYKVHSILNDNFIRALKPAAREELLSIVNKLSQNKQYEFTFRNNRLLPLRIDTTKISPSKVVAELNFIFWENMLSNTHRIRWINNMYKAFPCLPNLNERECQSTIDRIHSTTSVIRHLRNRICHHEPIFNEQKINLLEIFENMKTVLSYISIDIQDFLNQFERITLLLGQKPHKRKR